MTPLGGVVDPRALQNALLFPRPDPQGQNTGTRATRHSSTLFIASFPDTCDSNNV